MQYNNQALQVELMRDEGAKIQAYQDSLGYWTIGVGHLLGRTQRMTLLTPPELEALLTWDIKAAELALDSIVSEWRDFDDVRQRALVNMTFNLGYRLHNFTKFLTAVHAKDWKQAAAEMMLSTWAVQVGKRAERLHKMIETGDV